jgi:glutamate synthase domain-containing protein 2/glutamate synthase domain-containing protein 1/glutamate synthase domain-containing protein 3
MEPTAPQRAGLYDPAHEHDACGVGFVARLHGPNHEVISRAILALENMEHRGAQGADPTTGDGAGVLFQMPDRFFRQILRVQLPPPGSYGVAVAFLPREESQREKLERLVETVVEEEGQQVIAWRDVPVDDRHVGRWASKSAPYIKQLFIAASEELARDQDAFERKLYVIRRVIERRSGAKLALPSCSSRTVVYKGMLTAPQLHGYFPDLHDDRVESALALVHSRFSTNTFPSWALAHPYRMIAHNGEVNTLMGNLNWMRARESQLACSLFGDDLYKVLPTIQPGGSDSASFDNVLELLVLGGRSLPHALMMMIPEPWEDREDLSLELREFYAYHACLMEPWDGPAAVAFTDGRVIGATLDRNGLRPGRWAVTRGGYVVLASETGVLPILPEEVVRKGRLQPGNIFLVDLEQGRVVENDELKHQIATQQPYGDWYREHSLHFDDLREAPERTDDTGKLLRVLPVRDRQLAFGYSQEDFSILLAPMARTGVEPTGSMGNDVALAVLSDRRPPLFNYFKQRFAQVTNPAIDPIREDIVMSLTTDVGTTGNLLQESPEHAHVLVMRQPILRDPELERLRKVSQKVFASQTIDITWPVEDGPEGMLVALRRICREASEAIADGLNVLILSDRQIGPGRAPIPSLLATACVHHHLVREGTRLRCGLVLESGEPREVHHMAVLLGYGASAINPYLLFESLTDLPGRAVLDGASIEDAEKNVVKALGKGLLKTMSKMGISTISSYRGAQIFEAVGLDCDVVDRHFTGTASQIGGVGLDVLAREALDRHARAWPDDHEGLLPAGGIYAWRRDGERHMWDPETIAKLQHAARAEHGAGREAYREFSRRVNEENARHGMLRGLLELVEAEEPVPLDEVEPVEEIVKRFSSGGMSLGALSPEAHETLAMGMNRMGGRSNTGEGGEDPRRDTPDPNGDLRRSSIKQVASGRFGVTIGYLVEADQIQIKIAQGAKPGEGGQLPGHKVDEYIGGLRHSTPGVGLISPPPHHDIYSIEDLKQLIYDLRCANPNARVSVKLVAEIGVGTVAAGVAKANADHVTIAGHDGGTGASPLSSIQHAGVPWEIGLAETQQTLLQNDLRSRIRVEADGQMRTGRDVVIAAALGADEFGFSTAPLIALGCIMMRVCHMNTCPVGIASQDPELRKRFEGKPEHVVNYLWLVAEEVREIMSRLGVRRLDDLIGRSDLLRRDRAIEHWKANGVDLTDVLAMPQIKEGAPRRQTRPQQPVLDDALDHELIDAARPAIEEGEPVRLERNIRNVNRTVGGLLSSAITRARGSEGLPAGSIQVRFRGSAGQSFGAWLAPGVTFALEGDANDYTGKGLSGGTLSVRPPDAAVFAAEDNVVVGNTVLYGATAGKAFFSGLAGERFAVRNSGAHAVIEGCGDHGCEYMTGGRVAVLGPTGRNFAAGMSGGIAYVLDEAGDFAARCNHQMVGLYALDDGDAEELRELIAEHRERTRSPLAGRILAEWDAMRLRFVKVYPHDYKRVLEERAAASAAEGEDGSAPVDPASLSEYPGAPDAGAYTNGEGRPLSEAMRELVDGG